MTGDGKGADPLPETPPEWVPLIDLPGLIAKWYDVDLATIAPETAEAVWTGELRDAHRVSGLKSRNRQYGAVLPSGCDRRRNYFSDSVIDPELIFAKDWAAADVNRQFGTVGGWPQPDGIRERLPVELPWTAVKNFVGTRLRRWKRVRPAEATALLQAVPSPAITLEKGPKRSKKLTRIKEALEYLRANEGIDIVSEPNGKLQSLAENQAKIKVSLSTFERAVAQVRRPS